MEVPFQVQLLYTRKNGMQCLRVTTAKVAVTEDRAEAEALADVEVISTHSANRAAKLAKVSEWGLFKFSERYFAPLMYLQFGKYEEAQMENRAAIRFLKRKGAEEESESYAKQVVEMDRAVIEEKEKFSSQVSIQFPLKGCVISDEYVKCVIENVRNIEALSCRKQESRNEGMQQQQLSQRQSRANSKSNICLDALQNKFSFFSL